MNDTIQNGLVLVMILLSAGYVITRVVHVVRGKQSSGCSKCTASPGKQIHSIVKSADSESEESLE